MTLRRISQTYHEQTGRYFTLCKRIWDNIDQQELKQIKEYLKMMGEPKFGKAELEQVRNGVDLLPLLQERDLHGINKLSFIKTLLKHMKRYDLLKDVCNYENESAKAAGAKPKPPTIPPRPKLAPTYASSDRRHLQQSINTKKFEIKYENINESILSANLEKLRGDIENQHDIIADSENKLIRLELEKKQKQENELKYREEREKIEVKIKQLQKESSNKCDLERSSRADILRMSQTELNLQYLISQSKCKKKEISKRHQDESLKERKCSQTINRLQLELHKLELQINFQYQPRQWANSNENDLRSGPISDVTTDVIPTERAHTINKEYRTQHEPSQSSHEIDPTYNDVIILSAEENADQSSSFQDHLKEIQEDGTIICESIVIRGQLTDDFLDETNDTHSSC